MLCGEDSGSDSVNRYTATLVAWTRLNLPGSLVFSCYFHVLSRVKK